MDHPVWMWNWPGFLKNLMVLVVLYKIHDKHSLNSFSAHVLSWKIGRTNTFPVEYFLFWKKHWLLMLLTQLEFNDFRIQSHQIWHDICTFMHDQKNPSIGLWEKNPQWSKQRFKCWKITCKEIMKRDLYEIHLGKSTSNLANRQFSRLKIS